MADRQCPGEPGRVYGTDAGAAEGVGADGVVVVDFWWWRIAFPSAGVINVQATAAQTAALPAGYWRYDLELVDGAGRVYGIAEGCFEVAAEVTR